MECTRLLTIPWRALAKALYNTNKRPVPRYCATPVPRPVTIILLCIQYIVVSMSNFMDSCHKEEKNVFTH